MSRYQRPVSQPPKTKYTPTQLNTISSVSNLLSHFVSGHQKKSISSCWKKMVLLYKTKKRSANFLANKLANFYNRKCSANSRDAFSRLYSQKLHSQTEELSKMNEGKAKTQERGLNMLGIMQHKIRERKQRLYFEHLKNQIRKYEKSMNFKSAHFKRVFSSIQARKMRDSMHALKMFKMLKTQQQTKVKRLQHFFQVKQQRAVQIAFRAILIRQIQPQKTSKPEPKLQPSRSRQITQPTPTEEPDKKEVERKNKKLQEELRRLKVENQAIIEEYKSEIKKLQSEQEGLRFTSDLLDQNNRELEMQIIQRQKQGRKRMSNKQMWDHVYNNFLYMISKYKNTSLPKEKVLEFLETPLAPLNLNVEMLSSENEILSELLEEYRRFYGQKNEQIDEQVLPYEILSLKNRFFYLVAESLLSHGIGNVTEVEQLKGDLDALIQKNNS